MSPREMINNVMKEMLLRAKGHEGAREIVERIAEGSEQHDVFNEALDKACAFFNALDVEIGVLMAVHAVMLAQDALSVDEGEVLGDDDVKFRTEIACELVRGMVHCEMATRAEMAQAKH